MTTAFLLMSTVVLIGSGCNGIGAPKVVVRSAQDTVVLHRNPDGVYFNVSAVVRSEDSRPLYIYGCRFEAQREISGVWTTLFMPACMADPTLVLAPGDSVQRELRIAGFTSGRMYPPLDPRMVSGRYRVVFGVTDMDPRLFPNNPNRKIRSAVSQPFAVEETR